MYCIYCGYQIEENSKYCGFCGRPIDDVAQSTTINVINPVSPMQKKLLFTSSTKKRSAGWFTWILYVLATMVGIGVGFTLVGLIVTIFSLVLFSRMGGETGLKSLQLQLEVSKLLGTVSPEIANKVVNATIGFTISFLFIGLICVCLFGSFVGLMQWLVIRTHIVANRSWIIRTASGLLVGSIIGIISFTVISIITKDLGNNSSFNSFLNTMIMLATMSIGIGAGVGITQSSVLHPHVPHSNLWIIGNIAGWLSASVAGILIGRLSGCGGAFAGIFLGSAITGAILVWLLQQANK